MSAASPYATTIPGSPDFPSALNRHSYSPSLPALSRSLSPPPATCSMWWTPRAKPGTTRGVTTVRTAGIAAKTISIRSTAQQPCAELTVQRNPCRAADIARQDRSVSLLHLHQNWAHPCHICTGTGLAAATSATEQGSPMTTSPPGSVSPLPHLHREWAHPYHICTGIGLTAATSAHGSSPATSAPGLPPAFGQAAVVRAPLPVRIVRMVAIAGRKGIVVPERLPSPLVRSFQACAF